MGHVATNPNYTKATSSQAHIGWGRFFKGFCSIKIQKVVNLQHDKPLNAFEQLRWTSEIVQCIWDSESEHWKQRSGDKHGHTPAETDAKKHGYWLAMGRECQTCRPTSHPDTERCSHMQNAETWVSTTQETIHYPLNMKNLPDDESCSYRVQSSANPHMYPGSRLSTFAKSVQGPGNVQICNRS
jgi:hypothetical protein